MWPSILINNRDVDNAEIRMSIALDDPNCSGHKIEIQFQL